MLLQVFGLVLATKQPATTAAAFARIIRDNRGLQRSSKLTDFVARITSTQLAAAIGNVVAVSAGAVLFEIAVASDLPRVVSAGAERDPRL